MTERSVINRMNPSVKHTKKGHDLNCIFNTFILKVKHNFAELVTFQTNLKSRAGHRHWKKESTTDTDNQQPTSDNRYSTTRNQQQPLTETPDHRPSALDNRHLSICNLQKQTDRYTRQTEQTTNNK